ncbi:RagB/SusD family nutrient uptake outer membrane protein [Spirosoma sp. KCTC 42546]|uniref:RagB/SusD family nutrient uptake outer membrane protein n=1 Tax=Spirosoma sp. KCTC 42546 TaxID=2520506 RepID=UPI00115796D9|nr:RagB/SusD family nutrient uptake outer membrane protein [Spirosoma sp. KCTC 42546]QDK77888.1 RagB/SusD family nutrient uptake outer membrane protein [Spirosoma sp. KCTC 42546]
MKKILFLLSIIVLTSCENVLKEEPKSLAVETYYNTPAEVQAAVNAIYTPLRDSNTSGMGVYIAVLEGHIDYGYGRGSYAILNNFQGLDNVNISRVSGAWSAFYLSIRNANLVIKNAPNGKAISKADITKSVAEAKFLRAFSYFHLVRNWAGVPVRTEANMTEITAKRNTVDEVYSLILADLQEAEANLPDQVSDIGRPTKWAAKTMLADVYLQLGKFAEARDKADEVIKANKFALVQVATTDDFQKIFGPDVVTTTEEIFSLKFSHQPGQGNLFPTLTNHPGTKLLGGGGGVFGLYNDNTNPTYMSWDNADLRKGLWYSWNIGIGTTSLLSKKYIDPNSLEFAGAANDVCWYRYADLLMIYAEAAARLATGPTAAAMEALNQVHRRAYGKPSATASTVDFKLADYATSDAFLNLVVKEYGYEFQYEGKRWLELKRTGKAADIILAAKGKTIAQKHYLWPIPVSEVSYNTAIDAVKDQNPGY